MEVLAKESARWLRQAEYDLKAADWNLEGGFFAPACFLAQQGAAKALRAYLFLKKEDTHETRSVVELLERAVSYEESFKEHIAPSGRLDIYYKTSRFPDSIPGGVPSEVIIERDAREAIVVAADIIRTVELARKEYMPETI
jgi:HEPN domain-containing protein